MIFYFTLKRARNIESACARFLKCLHQFKLYAKLSKCSFMIQKIEFLKYIISNHEIAINLNKIEIIKT